MDPKPLSQSLRKALGAMGLNKAISRHSIIHRWPKLVDSVIASHAKVDRISADTIFIIVDSAVWMSELSAIRLKLLERVNSSLERGAAPFTDMRFTLRSWARTDKPEEKIPIPAPPPDEKDKRMANQILGNVKDEALREVIDRIIEKDRLLKTKRKTPKEP